MVCSFSALRNKEVVNVKTGEKIGFIDDLELDSDSGRITSLIIYGRSRAFGLMGRDEDIVVRCSDIELIGEDTVLVRFEKDAICIKSHNCRVENLLK
ncbi:sporulation protein, YlmC/YmxH family [Ruminococcaceae bacterium FB2012]|nr:sporulation protein, YlmC/YmxH family [Ruminococcaceae bacterium FB2012]